MKSGAFFIFVFILLKLSGIRGSCYRNNLDEDGEVNDLNYRCDFKIINRMSHVDIDITTCRNTTLVIGFHIVIAEIKGFNFRTSLQGSQEIPIPGFSLADFLGLYLSVKFYDNAFGEVKLKMSLYIKAVVKITTIPLIDEKISTENCNGGFYSNSNLNRSFLQSKFQTFFIVSIVFYVFFASF